MKRDSAPARALALACALLPAIVHCGNDGSNAATQRYDAGAEAGEAGEAPDGDSAPGLPPEAPFSIVKEPDTGCIGTTSARPTSLGLSGQDVELTDLGTVGARRVASTLSGRGFVVFDANGTGVSPAPIAVASDTRAAGSTTSVLAVGVDASSNVVMQRFDPAGAPSTPVTSLGRALLGPRIAVATSGDKAIAVWATPELDVHARLIDEAGAGAAEVTLEADADFSEFTAVAAPSLMADGSLFLVVWALRRTTLAAHRVYAALVGPAGIVGLPRVVLRSDIGLRLVKLVTHPRGAALLANLDGEPLVVPLDGLGRLSGPTHLLEGAREQIVGGGHGLAVQGEQLGIVARHSTGAHVLRSLDLAGAPLGGWVCLDAPTSGAFHLGSLDADGAGWSALVNTPTGSALLRLDRSGLGPL